MRRHGRQRRGQEHLTALYAASALADGQAGSIYCFDESRRTYLHRSRSLGLNLAPYVDSGLLQVREYGVGDLTPGRFMRDLRADVEQRAVRLVILDSFTGYLNLMPYEEQLVIKLHETLRFLSGHGVLSLITVNIHGMFGATTSTIDTSYLADAVVLMRHFEAAGSVRRCISVMKKRHGDHERDIREIEMGPGGLRIGPPLREFSGVLTGEPRFHGEHGALLSRGGGP